MSAYERNDIETMVTFWPAEDAIAATPWVEENPPIEVTRYVLIPAVKFGKLKTLKMFIHYGDVRFIDNEGKHMGWNLYHYAVKGYQMIHPNLDDHDDKQRSPDPNQPATKEEAKDIQLDIIQVLAKAGTPFEQRIEPHQLEENIYNQPPLHSSLMALDYEYNFIEAAFLIDILAVVCSQQKVPTPGLDRVKLPSNREHRRALQHVMEWAYSRNHLDVLGYCHDRFLSICSDSMRLRTNRYPMFLDAVHTNRLDVIRLIFNHESERPIPDRLMSKYYQVCQEDPSVKTNAISIACDGCLQGHPIVINSLLTDRVIGKHLVNISLSELGLEVVPTELFHETLTSISVSMNNLTALPPVKEWKCQRLLFMSISDNRLRQIPPGLFSLPNLSTLNANNNEIEMLDNSLWTAPSLKSLHLSKNWLRQLPCPEIVLEEPGNAPIDDKKGQTTSKTKVVYSIGHGFVDIGANRDEDYHKTHSGYNLEFFDMSDNHLTSLPKGLACLAPMLRTLKLSRNRIRHFGHVSDYPTQLRSLELIGNDAEICIQPSTVPSQAICLQSQLQNPVKCMHGSHNNLNTLQHLNIGRNQLMEIILEVDSPLITESQHPTSPTLTDNMLFPKLQSFMFSQNQISEIPRGIHKLQGLRNLDISQNERIKHIPLKIHQLKELVGFQYKGISDPIIHQLDTCKDIGHVLYYLRARETDAVPNLTMRLILIGHYHKGKSTILRMLQGRKKKDIMSGFYARLGSITLEESPPVEHELESTVGIDCGEWINTRRRSSSSGPYKPIKFNTWDFAGQEEYYQTHQCFLTNRALYLLVWRLTDKHTGIDGLDIWLRNLQVRAPGAQIIVVGTHLDVFRRSEGRNTENLLEEYRKRILEEFTSQDRTFPKIRKVVFVGLNEATGFFGTTTKYDDLNDIIHEEASNMEIPKTPDMPASFHMKILDEKIPKTYLELEKIVNKLSTSHQPIIERSKFCERDDVKKVICEPGEVDVAINFLHNMGTVLHFHMTMLEDYYILNPQWWFDACALVVSPNNVSTLVTAGGDPTSGLLKLKNMVHLFQKKGYTEHHASLVFQFLHQFGVILPIDKETALVPSLVLPTPMVKLFNDPGMFPWGSFSVDDGRPQSLNMFQQFLPEVAKRSLQADVKIKRTGLVLRRMFLLPPMPAGFWSKVISLCLQKDDFPKIIAEIFENQYSTGGHGLFYHIGSCHLKWSYWKTGILLYLDENIILSINSLKADQFTDPMEQSIISETNNKIQNFHFVNEDKEIIPVGDTFSDVIEIIVPEVELESHIRCHRSVSAKLLAKALEILDEVLKGHCDSLADDGVFSIGNLCHVIPCPLCFGDRDNRPKHPPHRIPRYTPHPRIAAATLALTLSRSRPKTGRPVSGPPVHPVKKDAIVVFTIDQCIRASMDGEYIQCPNHNHIKLEYLVPDLIFKDLSNMKLDKTALYNPVNSDGRPVGSGCFGVVYHKLLPPEYDRTGGNSEVHVAVKEFKSGDMEYDAETEVVKTYADMRYELNKLSILKHDYVVKFVGLLTNPLSFVLEWAPLMSLEKIRQEHEKQFIHFCPVSLYIVLLQVADGLHYLHTPPIGIIHSDLKLSNILAYRFPDIDHYCCYNEQDRGRCCSALSETAECGVLVKLGDMGVCVNPGQSSRDNLGVKRFAPECNLALERKLTEKVDIFCLAICLYELLTIKGLPPRDVSEQEYRASLARNWRPLFHSKDLSYPLPLYLFLEQCWQQDYNKRPPASVLRDFMEGITGLSVKRHFDFHVGREKLVHLLDGYLLVPESEVTAFHMIPDCAPLTVGLAIKGNNGNKVVLARAYTSDDTGRTTFELTDTYNSGNEEIAAVHVTHNLDIIVGCKDGKVIVVKSGRFPEIISKDQCNHSTFHGEVSYITFIEKDGLIVTGFTHGHAHIIKVDMTTHGDRFLRGVYCCGLENQVSSSYEVVYDERYLEIWCGCDGSVIEIWKFELSINRWRQSDVKKTSGSIPLQHPAYTPHSSCILHMSISADKTSVFALIGDQIRSKASAICQVDPTTKKPTCYWQCSIIDQVSCFKVTSTDILIGTQTGHSIVYPLKTLTAEKGFKSSANTCDKVLTHSQSVSSLLVFDGEISRDGCTSMFHTYMGKQKRDISCRFLVSLGHGFVNTSRFSDKAPKNSSTQRDGCCISVWLI